MGILKKILSAKVSSTALAMATVAAAGLPSLAAAQSEAAAESGSADDNVIIVTAQRRAEALEDVPMSVSLLTAETLANSGVSSLRDLANVTSGYQLGQGGNTPQPAIRGVTTLINGNYENNVAVYIDGLYQSQPLALAIDLPNVSGIQVLKGPQGTLYGRNATGGAILVDTITPGDRWEGRAEATYARFDDKRIGGYVAGPINDTMGISLAGYTRRTDGYFKKMSRAVPGAHAGNAFPKAEDAVRAKLAFAFTESLNVEVGYNYTFSSDARGVLFSPIENVEPFYNQPGGSTRAKELGEASYDFTPEVSSKQNEGYVKLKLDTRLGQLRSVTGYSDYDTHTNFDFDGSYIPGTWGTSYIRDKLLQQSVDLSIDTIDKLDVLVGGQYFRIRTHAGQQNFNGPAFLGRPYDPTVETPLSSYVQANENFLIREKEAWAVFADATLNLGDLAVTAGGRYSEETQQVEATRWNGNRTTGTLVYSPATGADKKSKYKKFTPRLSLRYELTSNTNVYASYSKGFRSGEWNGTVPNNNPAAWTDVDQETIDAYEVGLKHAGSRLRFDLAGFYYDYANLQVSSTIVFDGTVTPVLQNAPSAEIYGVEGNISYELADNFNLRAGATWLHARYGDDFIFTGVGVTDQAPAGGPGINVNADPLKTFQNIGPLQNVSGLQMSRAPNLTAYAGADYSVPIGEGGILFAVNAKYTDDYVVSNPSIWGAAAGVPASRQREQRFVQKAFTLINGSITITDPSDTFYVRLWGNNLTDRRYRIHYNGTSTFGTYIPMAEPRTYGVTVGFKFREEDEMLPLAPPPPPPPPAPAPAPATMTCPDGTVISANDACPVPPPPPPPEPERG